MKPYCLKCFTPLPEESATCSRCGFVSVRSQRQRYWNRNPHLIAWEKTLKTGIAIFCLLLIVLVVLSLRGTGSMSVYSGYAVAFPVIAAGVALWQTASRLTRRSDHFGPVFFWCLALFLLGLFFLYVDYRFTPLFLIPVPVVVLIGRACARWKWRKMASRGAA